MKTPESLVTAVDCGVIQEVLRPLMSGKEAQVYVVVVAGSECVAKVYKEASQRTFKHRAAYTEGRRTRNSRDQRAMSKRSRHGRAQDEAGWRSAEVDTICRLRDAGVRVPAFINFVDGVLVMELVKDAEGDPAPRLGDLSFAAAEAREIYQQLLREVTRMLCAGVIHGDLSEFNVLMGVQGPVLIDFPQSIDAARNQSARKFLLRDVDNLHRFVERHAPHRPSLPYAEEMWSLYETSRLEPDTELRGDYRAPEDKADTGEVLALIEDADREEDTRREARGEAPRVELPRPMRTVVDFAKERTAAKPVAAKGDAAPKNRRSRRRRRRKKSPAAGSAGGAETAAPGSERSTTRTEKKSVGSGEAKPSNRRRRAGRAGTRGELGEAKAGAPSGAERPAKPANAAKPAADRRGGSRSPAAAGGADRPARRRRRRPRRAGSREPT